MAVHQAADTFFLITGIRPDVERMFASFTRLVGTEAPSRPAHTADP
jgi:shikimate 5-dehydrogenase